LDDLKLIGRSERELRNEIRIVKTISNDMKRGTGLEKCARVSLECGKVHRKQRIGNTVENEIKELESMKSCKYMGVEDSHNMEHNMRIRIDSEHKAKCDKMKANGTLAVPALRYSFGIISSHQGEIQKLDRKTRKILTIHGQHHPRVGFDR
jgi:hypothetical protein